MDFDSLQDDSQKNPAPQVPSPSPQATQNVVLQVTPPPDFDALQDDSEVYGSSGQQALAGLEGVARGLSLGTSDLAEARIGEALGLTDRNAIRQREEQNPWTSNLGTVAGVAALGALTGGAGFVAEAAGGGALGALTAGALEGAVIGGGSAVSDYALGNAPLTAQKVATEVGMGAMLGSATGLAAKGIEAIFPKASESLSKAIRSITGSTEEIAPEAITNVADSPPLTGKKPTSIEEMAERVKAAKDSGQATYAPQYYEAQDALSRIGPEMEYPPHQIQMDSLKGQTERDAYGVLRELPGSDGDVIRGYESLQRIKDINNKTDQAIMNIAPGRQLTPDAVESGQQAADAFTNAIQKIRDETGPQIAAFKEMEGVKNHTFGVVDALTNPEMPHGNPKIANMFEASPQGALKIKPFDVDMGIAKKTYGNIKDAVESLQKGPSSYEKLFDIRKSLVDGVNPLEQGGAGGELGQAKAAMMDYIQTSSENPQIRDYFARYAKNEENARYIEKTFGAEIGSDNFKSIARNKPEEGILKNIFKNTRTVQAAKSILPQEEFQTILGNWLRNAKEKVTDKGVFSSNKFGSFLRKNQDVLNESFQQQPEILQRIRDFNTVGRILPDAPPINPSGTAKTLLGGLAARLGESKSFEHAAANILGFIKEHTLDKLTSQIATENLNNKLAGRAANATIISKLSDLNEKVGKQIGQMAADIFRGNGSRAGAIGTVVIPQLKDFESKKRTINELSDPQRLLDHTSQAIHPLTEAAPNVAQAFGSTIINSVNFLNSKMPRSTVPQLPLAGEWQPSKSAIDQFNRYYEAINSPLRALTEIKNGDLTNETMEALQAVHPQLLQEMQKSVMEHLQKAKNINYGSQLALAKFLGMPLNESMMPQAIMANQNVINPPLMPQLPQKGRQASRPPLGGLKNLNIAKRSSTETQDLEREEI